MCFWDLGIRLAASVLIILGVTACGAPENRTNDGLRTLWWCSAGGVPVPSRERYPPGWYQGVYYSKEYIAPNCHPGEHAVCDCDTRRKSVGRVCTWSCAPDS